MKLVSIVMPTYNCARFIGEAIASALKQTYENIEVLVVDDCSTDSTRAVVEAFTDPRVRYIALDKNSGAAIARTRAMAEARGDYIAFLDSDDVWAHNKLDVQLRFMRDNGLPFSCTAYDQIDEDGAPLGRVIKAPARVNYNRLLLDCPVGNSTVVYDVQALGKFTVPDIKKRNDDALWLQMLKKTKYIYGLDEVLAHYRIRRGSISSGKLKLIKYHWILYREIEHLCVPRALFHIAVWGFIKILHIK